MKLKRNLLSQLKTLGVLLFLLPLFLCDFKGAYALIKHNSKGGSSKPRNFINNWGLQNAFPSHINAIKAWRIHKGSRKIVVAVIDTGIDPNHPDLKDNLWKKPGTVKKVRTKSGKFKETFEYGWDFVTNTPNPRDSHGHGTHVAGIVGATAKGNGGAAGVAREVSIMAIRYYSESATGAQNLSNTIKAIYYAIENGAHIINYSGGGAEFSAAEFKAIRKARQRGILFVAAAGNEHHNTDKPGNQYYPGAYGLDNILTVAATNIRNHLLPSSNWGLLSVDVAAPGENIYSTLPNGKYGYLSGTSQATAFATGLAALIISQDQSLPITKVRKTIIANVDSLANLKNKVGSGGRINAYLALRSVSNKKKSIRLASTYPERATGDNPFLHHPDFSPYEDRRKPARNTNGLK